MSGDMTLASLAHLGVDLSPLPGLLAQAGVACRLEVWQEERGGGPGCRVEVSWEAEGQPLRHPADIAAIFAAVPVADRVRHKALAVLEALTWPKPRPTASPLKRCISMKWAPWTPWWTSWAPAGRWTSWAWSG